MIAMNLFLSFSINILKNNTLKSTREVEGGLYIPIIQNLLLLLTNSTARLLKTSFTAVRGRIIVAVILD